MALEKQMELFEEGGLLQEGGSVDEESGNEVPTGSLKEEVRDDIPAQLSEGEFVMPADVVRYHGLDKMMALRDEAKMGLQRMEDMGQMGNADEAVIPDGVPFSMDDLDVEDEPVEMQVGGLVPGQQQVSNQQFVPGGTQQSQFAQYQPQYTPYQVPTYSGYQPPQPQAVPTAPTGLPSFADFVTPKYQLYVNDAGNVISIPVDANGNPLIPVPAGYRKMDEQAGITPTTPDTGITPPTTTVTTGGGDDGGGSQPTGPIVDQFGREEDPRITQVTKNEQFTKLAKEVDPRGVLEKLKDDFLGAVGASTTSQEYQKALNELSVGVANYTSDPAEQSRILADIRGNIGQPTRTELGMEPAPLVTDVEVAAQKLADEYSNMTEPGDFNFGDTGVNVQTTQMLAPEGVSVSEAAGAAKNKVVELREFQKNLGLSDSQSLDMLVALSQGDTGFITFPTAANPDGQRLDMSKFSKVAATTLIDKMLDSGTPELKGQVAAAVTKYNIESASRGAEDRSAAEEAREKVEAAALKKKAEKELAQAEAARKAKLEAAAKAAAAATEAARKAAEEEQRRQEQVEQERLRQLSETNINRLYGDSSDRDERQQQQAERQREADSFTREAVRDVADRVSSGRGFAEGGLAAKKKPKAKKQMKRGGLASKK
tara:strand:- start:61 stop:2025 length:1965 start_codon:yes stop_codon:yes gene_type:complete